MILLAHRANVHGPSPTAENTPAAVGEALANGWGLEIDIRRTANGRFYISHDALPDAAIAGREAEVYCAIWRQHPAAVVALNVKELGDEADLLRFLGDEGVLPQVVLFDMELIEPVAGVTARAFRALHPGVAIAARVSDRDEPIARALAIEAARVIWLDEFDRLWATEDDVHRLKAAGRTVYAVSPELHGFPPAIVERRWSDFIRWGVDGICTDHPAALEARLEEQGVSV